MGIDPITTHDFLPRDIVVCTTNVYSSALKVGDRYVVLEVGFWNVRVVNAEGVDTWVAARAISHIPRVTIVKKHLRRIVLGH